MVVITINLSKVDDIRTLEQATGPNPFGYWCGPDGQLYDVWYWQGHDELIPLIAEKEGLKADDLCDMISLGWTPVTVNQYLQIPSFQMPFETGLFQMKSLLKIISWHKRSSFFINNIEIETALEASRIVREASTEKGNLT